MRLKSLCGGVAVAMLAPGVSAQELEELVVSGQHDTRTIDVTDTLSISPDAAELLREAPGANVNTNGPITGIPQYRGMFGPRIAVSLDGNQLAPSGPNWMDPPLSYAVTAQLESLEVYRGIAPVSVAQEAIGGAIDARKRRIDFGNSDAFEFDGKLAGSAQSVNAGYQLDADLQAANRTHRFKVGAMLQEGDDAEFARGEILPSSYERRRYDIGYGLQLGDHSLQVEYGYNDTGESGTPALPMDIDYFEGDLYDVTYRYAPAGRLALTASVYASDLDHGMTNYHLRQPPSSPARWRQNIATTDNLGFRLQAALADDSGSWTAGIDGFSEEHDSNIDNPNSPMFFVVNFNAAERQVLGAFIERQQELGGSWSGELGLRVNRVSADAGEVNGTPAMMPPAERLRDAFNAADRDQSDTNIDVVARVEYSVSDALSLYGGLAQKQRSASYQERYLWLPMEATAGLADGQTYIGNIELDPERSRGVEFGVDFDGGSLSLRPRLFYNRVDDYIQGTPLADMHPATTMVRMMNTANGTKQADPLQFNNVDAELYGFDMDWRWQLSPNWSLSGLVNYVRGQRRDIDDDLYRIAPANMSNRLTYSANRWNVSVESVLYASQDRVSDTNRERESAGYGIVNLSARWQLTPALELAGGVDNVFDKTYRSHLGGYNRASNPDVGIGERLPGYGTNVFARVSYTF
jgi:iron complex outermembrane receptor protein